MLSFQCYGLFLLILGSAHKIDSVDLIFNPLNISKPQFEPSYYVSLSLIHIKAL